MRSSSSNYKQGIATFILKLIEDSMSNWALNSNLASKSNKPQKKQRHPTQQKTKLLKINEKLLQDEEITEMVTVTIDYQRPN